jgi:3-deoxy-D-manno-octulosonic-acid transferase
VGEVGVCIQLLQALERKLPQMKFVVSTTTSTGMTELEKKLPAHVTRVYYPIDRRRYVERALSAIHPTAVIMVEAEIWPNFLWRMQDLKIPLFLANARLSEKSHRGYQRCGFLFRSIFESFVAVGAQNEADAARLRGIGYRPEAVRVTGNLKFDAVKLNPNRPLDVPAMLRRLGMPEGARIIVAGSTHDGEEVLLAQIFQRLRAQFPDLFLVLVPRHAERAKAIGQELSGCGLKYIYRSELKPEQTFAPGEVECLLVNSTGELIYFYEQASIVFVGKSITARGGQNPIEPAALGKAVVFGPNMQNFKRIDSAFTSRRGAVQVQDAVELEKVFGELLADEPRRAELGRNALQVVRENQGATERTVEMIVSELAKRGIRAFSETL